MADGTIILASASKARLKMLKDAGIAVSAHPSHVDEAEIKAAAKADGLSAGDTALLLADIKARLISQTHPDAYVIGADQILVCDQELFDKPGDETRLIRHLQALRGRTHRLISAVAIVRAGQRLWAHTDEARLTMRAFSDAFLEAYAADHGSAVCHSVGGYHLEGAGVQLFDRVEGDYFTILGLPLLPLLGYLRQAGIVPS